MKTSTTLMSSFVRDSTAQLCESETTASQTIVLQPKGCLGGLAVLDFQIKLEQALETAALGVVLDMQQVHAVAPEGIAALARGLELAAILGKSIVFDSIDLASRKSLTAEWRISGEICFGPWGDLFEREFEQFLAGEMLRSLPC
jgi:anti-anti-sigma regulatory factor